MPISELLFCILKFLASISKSSFFILILPGSSWVLVPGGWDRYNYRYTYVVILRRTESTA